MATQPRRAHDGHEQPGPDAPGNDEHLEQERVMSWNLGVGKHHAGDAIVARSDVASEKAAAVMADDGVATQAETIDHALYGGHVRHEIDGRVGAGFGEAGSGQVDHVAGEVVGEAGYDVAPGGAVERPAVDEQNVRPATERAMRDSAVADVDESRGWLRKLHDNLLRTTCGGARRASITWRGR